MEAGHSIRAGKPQAGFEDLLKDMAQVVKNESPHLRRLFEIFAQEARFGRQWLAESLAKVPPGDAILEVGAGLMLLSCQLTSEGYAVTAIEPTGEGFSHFSELQEIVLDYARARGIAPEVLSIPVEELDKEKSFSLAFSINVMEHVGSVSAAIRNVSRAIRPGGEYRFICPNYLFPYEPHFEMPTLFSKSLTEFFFRTRILRSGKVPDPAGLWASLNWITVSTVVREARHVPEMSLHFERSAFRVALERVIHDAEFSARRANWVRVLARGMVYFRIHRMTEYLPPHLHPIIDCTLTRAGHVPGAHEPAAGPLHQALN